MLYSVVRGKRRGDRVAGEIVSDPCFWPIVLLFGLASNVLHADFRRRAFLQFHQRLHGVVDRFAPAAGQQGVFGHRGARHRFVAHAAIGRGKQAPTHGVFRVRAG